MSLPFLSSLTLYNHYFFPPLTRPPHHFPSLSNSPHLLWQLLFPLYPSPYSSLPVNSLLFISLTLPGHSFSSPFLSTPLPLTLPTFILTLPYLTLLYFPLTSHKSTCQFPSLHLSYLSSPFFPHTLILIPYPTIPSPLQHSPFHIPLSP